jgi:thiosulfate/3-mercaptopyruvate sulfurtransferase
MPLRPPPQTNRSPFLVTTDWVEKNLDKLIIFDGSWVLPTDKTDVTKLYLAGHIPGAQLFDVNVVKDTSNPLPHMLPNPQQMTKFLRDFGVQEDSTIVVYEQQGFFNAARVWWMLRSYGLESFILDGGLPRWLEEGRKVEGGNELRPSSAITANLSSRLVSSMQDVQSALDKKSAQVVDARAASRFRGDAPEPRPGLRAGHMPGAVNLKNLDELRAVLKKSGIDPAKPVISSCGSGVSAAMLCLVLASLGYDTWSLYDGSWSEWGSTLSCEVVNAA